MTSGRVCCKSKEDLRKSCLPEFLWKGSHVSCIKTQKEQDELYFTEVWPDSYSFFIRRVNLKNRETESLEQSQDQFFLHIFDELMMLVLHYRFVKML